MQEKKKKEKLSIILVNNFNLYYHSRPILYPIYGHTLKAVNLYLNLDT